jgi:hypothetical protein
VDDHSKENITMSDLNNLFGSQSKGTKNPSGEQVMQNQAPSIDAGSVSAEQFQRLTKVKSDLEKKEVQIDTQIESYKNERQKLIEEAKQKFGVSNEAELGQFIEKALSDLEASLTSVSNTSIQVLNAIQQLPEHARNQYTDFVNSLNQLVSIAREMQ